MMLSLWTSAMALAPQMMCAHGHSPRGAHNDNEPHATVVFVRHGQSAWNYAKRFTGWTDIDLTDVGREEAAIGGYGLRAQGLSFDTAYTSELRRAQETLAIVMHTSGSHDVPSMRHWRLNERHYGALQGRSKPECVEEFGAEQVRLWRNSYTVAPPLLSEHSPSYPGNDPKYKDVPRHLLPRGECLRDMLQRVVPFWEDHVVPDLRAGRRVLIAAHGHSIRALVKHLDGIDDSAIEALDIPNGVPLLYHLDADLQPIGLASGSVHTAGEGAILRGSFLSAKEAPAATVPIELAVARE